MKRHLALGLRTGAVLCLLHASAWAVSLGPPSPFDAQPPSTSAGPSIADQGKSSAPTTSTNSASVPGAVNNSAVSVWDTDKLTGDWGGVRADGLNQGVAISPSWTGEVFGNPSGGARRGVISDGLFNLALDLDPNRMSDSPVFDDMLFHANLLYLYGASLSGSFVGDFSNTSNIAGYNSVRLQEAWIQKQFWGKRLSLKAGNIAVDAEFFLSDSSALFINGTFGTFNLVALNVPNAPVYPLASPGVRVQFAPMSSFYVMSGVFGNDNGSNPAINNQHGTRFAFNGASGLLVMNESGYLINQAPNDRGLRGAYKIGSWLNTGNSTTFASRADAATGTGPLQSTGATYGVYGVMDQQLYAHGTQALSLFVRGGGAPSNAAFIDAYVDGGFTFTGFLPKRDSDIAGIAIARSHVSRDFSNADLREGNLPSTAETVLEATYKAQIKPWWFVQPDFQYIVTPGALKYSHNATVVGLRTSVTF